MAFSRKQAEELGWVFAAEQEGYFRAEKSVPSGKLINMQGVDEDEVLDHVEAWETYPVRPATPWVSPEPEPDDDDGVAA